jgi:hypothetical protein
VRARKFTTKDKTNQQNRSIVRHALLEVKSACYTTSTMSKTIILSPSNGRKKEVETLRLQAPKTNGSTRAATATPNGTASYYPPKKALSSAEKRVMVDVASVAKAPLPSDKAEEEEGANFEYQVKPQKTPLSMAVAMKVGTSPGSSSCFPDSFWIPFLEQEEYERQKMSQPARSREVAPSAAAVSTMVPTPRKLQFMEKTPIIDLKPGQKTMSFISITNILQLLVTAILYSGVALAVVSLLDAPYFRPILECIALCGRFSMGFALWIYTRTANEFLPFLCELYHQRLEDTVEDIKDWLALRL